MHDSTNNGPWQGSTENTEPEADDITQLRERLAFYESFDQLITDNISRAGDLLREAAAKKNETELALRSSTAEIEKQKLAERINYRRIFSGLLDQITVVQQNVERLAREVSDALDDLESVIPAAGERSALEGDSFPTMPTFAGGIGGSLSTGTTESNASEAISVTTGVDTSNENEFGQSTTTAEFEQSNDDDAMEPVDEFLTEDEAAALEGESSYAPANSGLRPGSDFSSVVQASVERVSQSYGSSDQGEGFDDEPLERESGFEDEIQDFSEDESPFDVDPEEPYLETAADVADASDPDLDRSDEFSGTNIGETTTVANGGDAPVSAEQHVAYAPDTVIDATSAAEAPIPEAVDVTTDDDLAGSEAWTEAETPASTTLLVHNVPRATTALSLKRYLEGLVQVHSVEPREYAEGVLRLQVAGDRPVGLEDLKAWPEAVGLESLSESADFVEVKLAQ